MTTAETASATFAVALLASSDTRHEILADEQLAALRALLLHAREVAS